MLTIIAALLPVLGLGILAASYFYIKQDEKGGSKKKKKKISKNEDDEVENDTDTEVIKPNELKKLIGIREIKNGIIYLENGGLRRILSVSTTDFELLTDREQEVFEDNLIRSSLSLNSPIQFFTTQARVVVKEPLENVNRLITSTDTAIPDKLKDYASKLAVELNKLEKQKGVYVRKSYCIVGVEYMESENKALNELDNRADMIANGLSQTGGKVKALSSEQTAQVFTDIFHKGSNVIIPQLIKDGALELYTEGVGTIVWSDKKAETEEKAN